MFYCKKNFNYLDKTAGVNKDGEKYISVSVIDGSDGKKYSFVSHDDKVINDFSQLNVSRFTEIKLLLGFERVFNSKSRFSNWQVVLLGVE